MVCAASQQVPNIALNPTLDGIQNAINSTAKAILQASNRLRCWGMVNGPPTYHDLIARDKEVVKSVLLLTGSIEHIKKQVAEYLAKFDKYSFLWTQDLQVGRHSNCFTMSQGSLAHLHAHGVLDST